MKKLILFLAMASLFAAGARAQTATLTTTATKYSSNGGTATFTATVVYPTGSNQVTAVTIANGGSGYTSAPTVVFSGSGGSGAAGTATVSPTTGAVSSVSITNGGSGYSGPPSVTFLGGGGTGALADAVVALPASVVFDVNLPPGFSYVSHTLPPGASAAVFPQAGDSVLEWGFSGFPVGQLQWTFVVSYPAGLSGSKVISVDPASSVYRPGPVTLSGIPNITLPFYLELSATQAIASRTLTASVAAAFTPVTAAGGTAPLSFGITPALPSGLSLDSATGAITGAPAAATAATTHTVAITDALGATASQTFSLTVNSSPAITTQPTANAGYLVGSPLTLSVVAAGTPAPTYQWRKGSVDLPGRTGSSLAFASLAPGDAGSYDVVATNSAGSSTSSAVSFAVYVLPTITTQPANQTIVAGQTANFGVVSSGGAPAPTYQWRRNGLNLPGATASTLALTNVAFDGGGAITVVLSNPGGSVTSNTAALVVNPIAPVINSAATATGVLGRSFVFPVTTTSTQADFTATGLPAGLGINPASGLISGTPTATGTASVNVTASNVTGTDTKALSITINPAPPIINSAAAASGRVGVAFTFAVLATNTPTAYAASGLPGNLSINAGTGAITGTPTTAGTFDVTLSASNSGGTTASPLQLTIDPPVNAPTFTGGTHLSAVQGSAFAFTPAFGGAPFTASFTATGLPAGLTLTAPATGTIGGTPTVAGTFVVTITATNAGGSTAVAFTLDVNPAATAPVITSASNTAATVGTAFSFPLTSSATPAASGYSATVLPALGLSLNPATGVISGTPTAPGTLTLQVRGTNTVGPGPQSVLVISVSPAATAPVITSSPVVQGRVGDVFTHTLTASNSPTGFAITSGTLPAGLTIASGVIGGTPTQVGQQRVWFAADNAGGRGLALEVLFNIAPAATTPVITSNGTAAGQVGQPFQYAITATNAPTAYGAAGLPAGLSVNPTTGVISGLPLASTTTPLSITLTATKGTEVSAPKTLLLTLAPAPATPVITSALTGNGRVGALFSVAVTASEGATSFVATGLPDGLVLNASTGVLGGTPTRAGLFTATLRAANAVGLGAPSSLVLNIMPSAAAPAITSAAAAGGKVGAAAAFAYQVVAAPGPITSYTLAGTLPLGLSFNSATGLLTGRPAESGVFTVQLTATNDGGSSSPQTLVLNIAPADNVPIVTSSTVAYGTVGAAFNYQITAVGAPAFPAAPFPAPFALDAVNLPAGLAVNPSTGLIQGQPLVTGTFVATLFATNSAGIGPYRDLTITIQPPTTAPVITSLPSAAAQVGTAFSHQITATQNPTGFEVLGAPAWLTVNSSTGALAGTPTAPGTSTVQLSASNASGSGSPVTLSITVAASAAAPVITSSRVATGQVLTVLTYQIVALVPSGAPAVTSYVATGLPGLLTLNPATGAITGTPMTSGQFEVTLIAKSPGGDSQPVTLILTIQPSVALVY